MGPFEDSGGVPLGFPFPAEPLVCQVDNDNNDDNRVKTKMMAVMMMKTMMTIDDFENDHGNDNDSVNVLPLFVRVVY